MTKTVQEVAPKILEEIKKAKRVLLHLHPRPDEDSIGSALTLWHAFKRMGKEVTLIQGDSALPLKFFSFPGAEHIEKKHIGEINLSEFDLFIIVDSAQIRMVSDMNDITFPPSLYTIVIDHHPSNTRYAQLNLVDSTYPATAQIIYDLFKLWGVSISEEIAQCLYVGMWADTGGFQYSLTNADTLRAAADLLEISPKALDVVFKVLNSNEPQHIAFQGLALSCVETFFDEQVAISFVPFEKLQEKGIQPFHTENQGISSALKSVKGWNVGISFVETKPNRVVISIRTRNELIDASKIAEILGGGGHKVAAGVTLRAPFQEAKKKLIEAIGEVLVESRA